MKLPQLLQQSNKVDSELVKFLETIEDYPEDEQLLCIERLYQAQLSCAEDVAHKVNAWCWVILKLESEAEFYRAQAARFSKLAKTSENKAKSMKGFIQATIEANGGKLPTEHFPKLRNQKTRASLTIDDEYIGEVPFYLYKTLPLSETLDKEKVREMLNAGHTLAFASFSESGKALYGLK